jgi:hypothetical protein
MNIFLVIGIVIFVIILIIVAVYIAIRKSIHNKLVHYGDLAKEHVMITSRAVQGLKDNNQLDVMNAIAQYVSNAKMWFNNNSSEWVQLMKDHFSGVKDLAIAIINKTPEDAQPAILALGDNQNKVINFILSKASHADANTKQMLSQMWGEHLKCTINYISEISSNGKSPKFYNLVEACGDMAKDMGNQLEKLL